MKVDFKEILHKSARLVDYVIPVAISVCLVVWLFHKVNFADIWHVARTECRFGWVIAMMAITTLSHMVRGIRWGIQLRAAGVPRMTVTHESVSIFGAYALNLVFPRLGEVWRCMYISRSEKVKLSTVVGTDFGDRISDLVVVIALTALCLVVAHGPITTFMAHYKFGEELDSIFDDKLVWLGLAAVVGVFWAVCHYLRMFSWVRRMDAALENVWNGFKVLFTMRGRGAYIVLTLCIWLCYYMETYVMFQAFPFTRDLVTQAGTAYGLIPGLVVFVFGSMSMGIPSNGGLGPWNIAVMFALSLYGIGDTEGATFAMTMWSCQAAWLVVLGLFSAGYIAVQNRETDKRSAVSEVKP